MVRSRCTGLATRSVKQYIYGFYDFGAGTHRHLLMLPQ